MAKFDSQQLQSMGLSENLPAHVGIIMDGNGRWAKGRGLPRVMGHRAGMNRLKGIIRFSSDVGVKALSMYAFSTENWRRPQAEVSALFELLIEYFSKEIDELDANNVCIRALGDIDALPEQVAAAIHAAVLRTEKNDGLMLNIAMNYGGRTEIARAARELAARAARGDMTLDEIDEQALADGLYTAGLPELDLVIRTAGDQRLSNFLLYQAAYAELMFVQEYWPDFSDERYADCLRAFSKRARRFGGL